MLIITRRQEEGREDENSRMVYCIRWHEISASCWVLPSWSNCLRIQIALLTCHSYTHAPLFLKIVQRDWRETESVPRTSSDPPHPWFIPSIPLNFDSCITKLETNLLEVRLRPRLLEWRSTDRGTPESAAHDFAHAPEGGAGRDEILLSKWRIPKRSNKTGSFESQFRNRKGIKVPRGCETERRCEESEKKRYKRSTKFNSFSRFPILFFSYFLLSSSRSPQQLKQHAILHLSLSAPYFGLVSLCLSHREACHHFLRIYSFCVQPTHYRQHCWQHRVRTR